MAAAGKPGGESAAKRMLGVKYLGYVDVATRGGPPGEEQAVMAHDMLSRKKIKETQKAHPLWGLKFQEKLTMEISEAGLYIYVKASASKSGNDEPVMNMSMHKMAYVSCIKKRVYIMEKKSGSDKSFRCKVFEINSKDGSPLEVTDTLRKIANEVFAKLRHVARVLEAKRKAAGPPSVPKRMVVKDEDQPWFHGEMDRTGAEGLLKTQHMTNGLFLVRQSKGSTTDFALSFCYNRKAYHNRILKQPDGSFKNTKGTSWPSLAVMVNDYSSPHDDMQTIITEYVPNNPPDDGGAYENVALLQEAAQAARKPWDTTDIQAALGEISSYAAPPAAASDEIAYDSMYDDIKWGFGDDFIAETLGTLADGAQPSAENSLDNAEMFMLGGIDGEFEC